eukprot:TRINITY_DN40389_c0_g1_i1.p1 TRINITY_DN40389_c0_g1~~TRINITY_DN40389_c0_g1_i1.p1  ORF type:complete len:145 (+),score=17.60 TRINITY_DN40389_c0_g1_i1:23-436(+)
MAAHGETDPDVDTSSSDEDEYRGANGSQEPPNAFAQVAEAHGTGYDALAQQEEELAGPRVSLVIRLPDGAEHRHNEFRAGHTVDTIKSMIETRYGIPYFSQSLYLNGDVVMLDPLSISDIKGYQQAADNLVVVKQSS